MLVRTDLPLADQLVQVGHACLEAGKTFRQPTVDCNLVVLGVPSLRHLFEALAQIEAASINYIVFYEPDDDMGETAACTEPLTSQHRRVFRKFRLWTAPSAEAARAPPR